MEIHTTHAAHTWEPHHLAAQILRSWVRETHGALPAWTPPDVANAYVALWSALEKLVQATQYAATESKLGTGREEQRHG